MNWFASGDPLVSLIFIIFVVIVSAISKFLKTRKGADDNSGPAPSPRRDRTEPAPKTVSWEEEIKRLLGELPSEPPPPPPPPPIVVQRPPPAPPVPRPRPTQAPVTPPLATIEVPPIFSSTAQTEESESHELHTRESGHMAKLADAESAYGRARRLQEATAARLEAITRATTTARPEKATSHRHGRSSEVEAVVKLLHRPKTARQVLIAQAVLGPPKSLEL